MDNADNLGLLYSLYSKIDLENLTTLNEEVEGSGKTIFRSWDERLLKEKVAISQTNFKITSHLVGSNWILITLLSFFYYPRITILPLSNSIQCVLSDCDDELLFNIPFVGNVKLKGNSFFELVLSNRSKTFRQHRVDTIDLEVHR